MFNGRTKEARVRDCFKEELIKVTFAQMPIMGFGRLKSLHLARWTSLVSINFIIKLKFISMG